MSSAVASSQPAPTSRPTNQPPRASTRYRTASNPPRQFAAVEAALNAGNGDRGYKDTKEMISTIRSAARGVYREDSSASELVRFLDHYGVLTKTGSRLVVDPRRLRRVREACEQQEDLALDFVLEAPQPPINGAGKHTGPKPVRIQRVAHVTDVEHLMIEVVHACGTDTVVGEVRSPIHMSDEEFDKSDLGQHFGMKRDVFMLALDRFVAAGILQVRKATGPGGVYDAIAFAVPFKEIRFARIAERKVAPIPQFILNIVARILALEGIASISVNLATTIRDAVITRFKGHGVRNSEAVADQLVALMIRPDTMDLAPGWGLLTEGHKLGDVVACYPGLGPVQLVPESNIMRGVIAREMTVPAPQVLPPLPRLLTVADIPCMDDAAVAQAMIDVGVLAEALQAEGPRRVEVARKAARKAELEARISASREATVAQAAEAARVAEAARLAQEVADAAAAEQLALEKELAAL